MNIHILTISLSTFHPAPHRDHVFCNKLILSFTYCKLNATNTADSTKIFIILYWFCKNSMKALMLCERFQKPRSMKYSELVHFTVLQIFKYVFTNIYANYYFKNIETFLYKYLCKLFYKYWNISILVFM